MRRLACSFSGMGERALRGQDEDVRGGRAGKWRGGRLLSHLRRRSRVVSRYGRRGNRRVRLRERSCQFRVGNLRRGLLVPVALDTESGAQDLFYIPVISEMAILNAELENRLTV